MPKKLKDWLIRRLGGYRTVYSEKTVVRNFSGEKVHAEFLVPNEYCLVRKFTEREIRDELAKELAMYIIENMPVENISSEKIDARDAMLYSANLWIDYDCNLRRRLE